MGIIAANKSMPLRYTSLLMITIVTIEIHKRQNGECWFNKESPTTLHS